ncbi:MAG: DUF4177 domain-containing protein [Paracoccaceae bacterium]|nr:DUF4177 domain-containing protein [Paracoccaceae bacterium]
MSYEYKVVPAPVRGVKAKGVKTAQDRFAHALQTVMNDLAAEGWEYLRADTLPAEQREGLMSKTTVYQNMLVFRRAKVPAQSVKTMSEPSLGAPRLKTGEERLAEKAALAQPKPVTPPKPPKSETASKSDPSSDVAAQ